MQRVVALVDEHGVQRQFDALVLRAAHVAVLMGVARTLDREEDQLVVRRVEIEVQITVQAVVEEPEVESHVARYGGFPHQIGVGHVFALRPVGNRRFEGQQLRVVGRILGEGLAAGDVVVARQADAGAQFQLREPFGLLEERLFGDAPGHGARGEVAPRLAFLELARPVGAQRSGHQVAVVVGVVDAREEREQVVGRRIEVVG